MLDEACQNEIADARKKNDGTPSVPVLCANQLEAVHLWTKVKMCKHEKRNVSCRINREEGIKERKYSV